MNQYLRVLSALQAGLYNAMIEDKSVLMLGEDIVDPYGGAFKVTKGLSEEFPGRVISTPISEAGITGVGIGLALNGFRPVVEIMFGDFLTLVIDQLINQASKIASMRPELTPVPMVLRMPMGGRRGYGPTHSQSIERLVFGVPGLTVVACSHLIDPGLMLKSAILEIDEPVIFIENKVLYAEMVKVPKDFSMVMEGVPPFATAVLLPDEPADISIITYGGMVPLVIEAAKFLRETEGLICELVVSHCLSPLETQPLHDSAIRTQRVVVVEEGTMAFGWGAEVAAVLSALVLASPVQRVGAINSVIPASRFLEDKVLPQVQDIVTAAIRTVDVNFKGKY
jgi:pyruvate/2-oxoglutarate/acetoin dehydrogenase E1 component